MKLKNWWLALCILLLVGCSAYGEYIEKGDKHFKDGDYASALAYYERAAEIDPESQEARQKIGQAKSKLVGEYKAQAQQSINAGDPLGAVIAASKAHAAAPDSKVTTEVINMASSNAEQAAAKFEAQHDFSTALMLRESVATNIPPKSATFNQKADATRNNWAAYLSNRADEAESKKQFGRAFVLHAKIAQLTNDPQARDRAKLLLASVAKDSIYRVNSKTSGSILGANVLKKIRTHQVGTLVISSDDDPSALAQLSFKASRPKFDTTVSTRTDSVRYQSGTKQVPNPFYESRLDDLEREERYLIDAQEDVIRYENDVARYQEAVANEGPSPNTSTGAEQSLSRAQSSLESARRKVIDQQRSVQRAREAVRDEPQFKEEPVYSDWPFTVETHTVQATSQIRATLSHKDGRSALTIDGTAKYSDSDDTHQPQPTPNLAGDPLQLPSQSDMTAKLIETASAELIALIDKSFMQWRDGLMQQALAAPDQDERVDLMVRYIISDHRRVAPEAVNEIKSGEGVPDAVALVEETLRD